MEKVHPKEKVIGISKRELEIAKKTGKEIIYSRCENNSEGAETRYNYVGIIRVLILSGLPRTWFFPDLNAPKIICVPLSDLTDIEKRRIEETKAQFAERIEKIQQRLSQFGTTFSCNDLSVNVGSKNQYQILSDINNDVKSQYRILSSINFQKASLRDFYFPNKAAPL
jgi:hypothetical protein